MVLRLTWDLPAEAEHVALCRHTIRLLLDHNQIQREDIDGIELMLGELCANVIRHAYDDLRGRYSVEVCLDGVDLTLSVCDTGRGFDTARLSREPQFTEMGGMGLFLMSHFADRIDFQMADGGGSTVVATRTLRRRPTPANDPDNDAADDSALWQQP